MSTVPRSSVTLVVIAKTPVPGRVKTRLCPPCTPEQAADIAAASLGDTLDAVAATDVGRRVIALEGAPGAWIPEGFEVLVQRGDGLDERLAAVVTDVDGPVVVIGMDTPQATPDLLARTVAVLCDERTDAVLGRADDGGYWVIGLRSARPDALIGVSMSLDTTGDEQLVRLEALGLRTALVEPLCDVDTFAEAVLVAGLVPGSRFAEAVARVAPVVATGTRATAGVASRG